jgi:tellurite resistance protein
MATKSDFTEQEWEALHKGVTGAGLLVSVSDRGFFDTFKETGALASHLGDARKDASSELVRELAKTGKTGFGMGTSQDELEAETLAALRTAVTTLQAKAPDELDDYRQFVLEVAESVAQAAGGGEKAESDALSKIRAALGASA